MIIETVKGIPLKLNTTPALFSPNQIDKGTQAMLSVVDFSTENKVLDLGCGYGVVGIVAAKIIGANNVIMSDVCEEAVKMARENAITNNVDEIQIILSDGFKNIEESDFTLILSNPPYHTDFSVPKHFIEKGFRCLAIGGKMVMVVKRRDWYKNKLIAIFGGVKIDGIDDYFVMTAEKRSSYFANSKRKKTGLLR